jgi:protein-L-isoaspartate(D-aspartate) O-methyltransferase
MTLSEKDLERLRDNMVKEQLVPRDISNPRVLRAFRDVPRHRFVLRNDIESAYHDHPLPIGYNQTISQPYIVALMLQLADINKTHRVLEIGTGSGYQTALLAELAGEVFSIERIEPLASRAEKILNALGYDNIHIRIGDGTCGWPEEAPFDRIIVTAASPSEPPPLIEQLSTPGRMVIPVGSQHSQDLVVVIKDAGGGITKQVIPGCVFVPLIGKYGWEKDI